LNTPSDVLAQTLAQRHKREYVLPTGNGTSALFLVLKALGLRDSNVAIPNNVCLSVPIAVLLSGNRPLFVDVEEDDLGLSPERLEERPEAIGAVVAVHAYGVPCRIEALARFCEGRSIPLIEDFALAQGAVVRGRPVGAFGAASVVSFGAGKIVSSGHGGAVLTNDGGLLDRIRDEDRKLEPYSDHHGAGIESLMTGYRKDYNEWVDRDLNGFWRPFRRRVEAESRSFLFRFSDGWAESISAKLAGLDENLARRARKAGHFDRLLEAAGPAVVPLSPPEGSVYWRFNVLIREGRNELLRRLLEKKFRISSWYGPVDLSFRPRSERSGRFDVSDRIGDAILNLWVNDEVDDAYAPAIAGEIVQFCTSRRHEVTSHGTNG
jgi:dTDP-4-amino-4,6-dideoxygalactose transaminase